ncbi:MAG TPA: hypothetical protein DDX29_08695 [Clostridiales bacterium]|nr:hypothetical protein [Clostridiales bacterium]
MAIPFTILIGVRIASQIMKMKQSNRKARISTVRGPNSTGEKCIQSRTIRRSSEGREELHRDIGFTGFIVLVWGFIWFLIQSS